jgi:hypothetical protein
MVKLVDMPDLGSGAARRVGSSPIIRTKKASQTEKLFLCNYNIFNSCIKAKTQLFELGFYFKVFFILFESWNSSNIHTCDK